MQEKERGSISHCRSQLGPSDGGDRMNTISRKSRFTFAVITLVAWSLILIAGPALAASVKVTLSGDQEVPPVKTSASGSGTITVGADKSVSGSITPLRVSKPPLHTYTSARRGMAGCPSFLSRKRLITCGRFQRVQNSLAHNTTTLRPAICTSMFTAKPTKRERYAAR